VKPSRHNPAKSRGLLSDIRSFVFRKPSIPTLIEFDSEAAREDYSHRIAQRLGINVAQYAILNIHRIGIEAPARHVFEELLQWDGRPAYWPNRIVKVERTTGRPEQLQFFLLGKRKSLLGLRNGLFGLNFIPLFRMDAVAVQHLPSESNFDNARYLLYECSGGYPVGVCGIYVRSPIADLGETEQAQAFFAVGFNFYGKENWSRKHVINKLWEGVHNRVTANVLNRFKYECEESFRRVQAGQESN
jgi:hypothetical protein